jgi:hypothetical protein
VNLGARQLGTAVAADVELSELYAEDGDVARDWTIDGQPLRDLVATVSDGPVTEISPLSDHFGPEAAADALLMLLGRMPGEFADGRVPLLVCSIDGDLGCGGFSARLVMGEDAVEWRDVGWEYDGPCDEAGADSVQALDPPLDLLFDRAQYVELLTDLLRQQARALQARALQVGAEQDGDAQAPAPGRSPRISLRRGRFIAAPLVVDAVISLALAVAGNPWWWFGVAGFAIAAATVPAGVRRSHARSVQAAAEADVAAEAHRAWRARRARVRELTAAMDGPDIVS